MVKAKYGSDGLSNPAAADRVHGASSLDNEGYIDTSINIVNRYTLPLAGYAFFGVSIASLVHIRMSSVVSM